MCEMFSGFFVLSSIHCRFSMTSVEGVISNIGLLENEKIISTVWKNVTGTHRMILYM